MFKTFAASAVITLAVVIVLGSAASSVMAISVNVNGVQVDTNLVEPDTEVNVNTGGSAGTNVLQVNTPEQNVNLKTIQSGGTNTLQVNTPQQNVNVGVGANGNTLNVNANGQQVQLQTSSLQPGSPVKSLSVQVSGGSLSDSEKQVFVNLSGGADASIQTSEDLNAYNKIVVEERPNVQSVSVNGTKVSVSYSHPAKFLGIFSTSLSATAEVDTAGQVVISLPWYSFLFSTNAAQVKTAIAADLQKSPEALSVQTSADGNTQSAEVRTAAHRVNVVTSVVGNEQNVQAVVNGQAISVSVQQ